MNKIVTISRQYASGGREIGRKLAEKWGIPFYDNELILRAAKESGYAEAVFESAESRAGNSLLYSIARGTMSYSHQEIGYTTLSLDDRIYLAQAEVIKKCAAEGPCVIVGRCADYVLRKSENLANVFVYADMPFRVNRATNLYGMSNDRIEDVILKMDKRRSNYYNFHTGEKWGRPERYSLCVNSSHVGVDKAVEIIKLYIEGM